VAAATAALAIPALAGAAADRGVQVQAQGGVLTFPGAVAADVEPGGTFGVLVGLEPVPMAELELSYQGAAYRTSTRVSPQQEAVVEHGGQAIVKVGPRRGGAEPYAFGGFGVAAVNVREVVGGPGVVRDDVIAKVPLGLGLDFRVPIGGPGGTDLLIGARGTYDVVFDNQAFTLADANDRSADQVAATLNLGARF
jgi:hypothetical protein